MEGLPSSSLVAPNSSPAFPQQGQIDWTAMAKSTVNFTWDALARLSHAGVEALTICAARVMFQQVQLSELGEQRIIDAVKALHAFPSYRDVLWFGFGVKHIVRSLSESHQGIACIGICSCMTEEFGSITSARILRCLFQLYNPPADKAPSLWQWTTLVEACEGAVVTTNFGIILSQLSRMCSSTPGVRGRTCSRPDIVAQSLKALFEVSLGTISRVHFSGGKDCAWIAAVAHWLLGLRVLVTDAFGDPLYRPGSLGPFAFEEAQVIICYGPPEVDTSSLVQRSYSLPNGRPLCRATDPDDAVLSQGRLAWSSCLCDAFGEQMSSLLTTDASHTGAILGHAAVVHDKMMCDPKNMAEISNHGNVRSQGQRLYFSTYARTGSFGRSLITQAKEWLPEIAASTELVSAMNRSVAGSFASAHQGIKSCLTTLREQCQCKICHYDRNGDYDSDNDDYDSEKAAPEFCKIRLAMFLCSLTRLLSQVVFPKGAPIQPTLSGLLGLYMEQENCSYHRFGYRSIAIGFGRSTQFAAGLLFSGRVLSLLSGNQQPVSAFSGNGVCFFSNMLLEVSAEPECAWLVHIVPGQILWNGHRYRQVRDEASSDFVDDQSRWKAFNASLESQHIAELADSSSRDLDAQLIIEESDPHAQSITARWKVSTQSHGSWYLGPQQIANRLADAHFGKTCPRQGCEPHEPFEHVLVEGEGSVASRFRELMLPSLKIPIIRVLKDNPIAVWIALDCHYSSERPGSASHMCCILQGQQCKSCTIKNGFCRRPDVAETCAMMFILTS